MKIRAAVLRSMGHARPYVDSKPVTIEQIELAAPGPGEMLVKMLAAGICHSDLSVVDGSRPRVMPMVLGHEACGEVVECGGGVADFAPGDRVVFSFVPVCGHCPQCAQGRAALCEPGAKSNVAGTLLTGARRVRDASVELNHHLGVSGFAEYAVVSPRSAVKIDRDLAPEIAALFGCAVLTGVGAAVNTARIQPGQSVAVIGLGGVGLAALLGARACGAQPIVAVDVVQSKLELARALGATHVIDARAGDVAAMVKDVTGGGADVVLETAGGAQTLAQAYAATRRGGTTVTMSLPDPKVPLQIPAVSLVVEERTLKGSYMGSAVPSRDVPRYIALYRAGRLPVEQLLTHTMKLDELNLGFDRLARGEAVRQVILF
ncbi:MAG TPA: zinc-dependent alcohol dehydrogenase family protein [Nevskiaceae bacterium]|nr:zinc-dependent alcohol dehydrogenase family protein [Nevskiaceae bacterium]